MRFDKVLRLLYQNGITKGFSYDFERNAFQGVCAVYHMSADRMYIIRDNSRETRDWSTPRTFPQYNDVTKVTYRRSLRGSTLNFMLRGTLL